ncbi:transposase [Streptomyces sp. NPDC017943]|uniref:IS701 family transposase n=1 Tax=Streptomyces sp. NPDC017943 TaxID=3365019 RepID=UPI0037AF6C41
MVRASSTPASRPRAGSVARHAAFDGFTAELFDRLPRADQRRWAQAYIRGLLVTPGRKTVRRLAACVSDSATAAQALHQFVNASPWDWEPVRARLTDWAARRSTLHALVLGAAVLPKRGDRSCGVHRRFVPGEGRTVNCQVGIGAFLAVEGGTVPVDWRLLLPGPWSQDPELRGRARVPGSATGDEDSACAQALALVDAYIRHRRATGPEPAVGPEPAAGADTLPVVADLSGFADAAALAAGLAARGRRFVLAVPDGLVVVPERAAPVDRGGAPAGVRVGDVPVSHRSRPSLPRPAAVATGRVRLPGLPVALRLVAERLPDGTGERIWLTDLVDRPPREVVALGRLATDAARTVDRLAEDFGLRAFEGRSYPGWHHHMTLVCAAYAYGTLGSTPPPAPVPSRSARGPRAGRPPRGARTPSAPARTAPPATAPTPTRRDPAAPTPFPAHDRPATTTATTRPQRDPWDAAVAGARTPGSANGAGAALPQRDPWDVLVAGARTPGSATATDTAPPDHDPLYAPALRARTPGSPTGTDTAPPDHDPQDASAKAHASAVRTRTPGSPTGTGTAPPDHSPQDASAKAHASAVRTRVPGSARDTGAAPLEHHPRDVPVVEARTPDSTKAAGAALPDHNPQDAPRLRARTPGSSTGTDTAPPDHDPQDAPALRARTPGSATDPQALRARTPGSPAEVGTERARNLAAAARTPQGVPPPAGPRAPATPPRHRQDPTGCPPAPTRTDCS